MSPLFLFFSFLLGGLFSLGLFISGMTNPQKVMDFFNVAHWDPSLAFVLFPAVLVYMIFFPLLKKKGIALDGKKMQIPNSKEINHKLIVGAVLFGIGWGLTGICPAPGLANFANGSLQIFLYIGFMVLGIYFAHFVSARKM